MTSKNTNRWSSLPSEDIMNLYSPETFPFDRQEYNVIVAVGTEQRKIEKSLKELGYQKTYIVENWVDVNKQLRDLFYDSYLKYHNVIFRKDIDGEQYLIYHHHDSEYRMYYPKNRVFRSSTLEKMNNVVIKKMI